MKNKKIKLFLLLLILISLTGCTKILQTEEKKPVRNELTGQNLVENILCKPEDSTTIELYKNNGVDIDKLSKCSEFKIYKGIVIAFQKKSGSD